MRGVRLLPLAFGLRLALEAEQPQRLVSVSDLHGDFDRAVEILAAAQLIDATTHAWIGGNANLVQTGDIVDRGDRGREIYELFFRLAEEAKEHGGSVTNMLGNHELMNIQNDLRYVSAGDFADYGGREQRLAAWAEDGSLGRRIRQFPVAVVKGEVLFAHAGLLPKVFGKYDDVESLNRAFAAALVDQQDRTFELFGQSGPVWTRYYPESLDPCESAAEVLAETNTLRMVVGHTIQHGPEGYRVRAICSGSVILGDTGISRAYGGEPSYIEHDGHGGAVVHYPAISREETLPLPPRAKLIDPPGPPSAIPQLRGGDQAVAAAAPKTPSGWHLAWMLFMVSALCFMLAFQKVSGQRVKRAQQLQ